MIRKPSPKYIGAFVTTALILLVALVLFFGSSSLLTRNSHFILFFDQSVNGLTTGSAVKFRGVPVGSVERIMIRANGQHPDSTAIPVVIKINRNRLVNDLGVVDQAFDPESIMKSIKRGLFAELSLESFITGQLFVELSVDPERSPGLQWHLIEDSEMMEIPTLSSSLDQITDDAADIIADLSKLDYKRLNENVNQVLENLAVALEGTDTEAISRSITEAADEVVAFVRSEELARALASANAALDEFSNTARSFNLNDGPLARSIENWTEQLSTTLEGLNRLTSQLGAMTKPDGTMRYELETMLRELSYAARSIRALANYLEDNPNALLTGRPEEE